jgi:uncharacterized BrkB/YihY/UPF0761 family membrane protein
MLHCPIKAMTGVDCPGCGFQRAASDLLRGDAGGAWAHYPPIFPFLLTLLLLVVALRTQWRWRIRALLGAFFSTLAFIAVHYLLKFI